MDGVGGRQSQRCVHEQIRGKLVLRSYLELTLKMSNVARSLLCVILSPLYQPLKLAIFLEIVRLNEEGLYTASIHNILNSTEIDADYTAE